MNGSEIPLENVRLDQFYYAKYKGPRRSKRNHSIEDLQPPDWKQGYIYPFEKRGSDLYFYECMEFPENTGRMLCEPKSYVKTSDVTVYDLERIKDPMPHLTGGRRGTRRRTTRRRRAVRNGVKQSRRHK